MMAEQDIKVLIRHRGLVQASLTRMQTFVDKHDKNQNDVNKVITFSEIR
jgi:hypothetical protein